MHNTTYLNASVEVKADPNRRTDRRPYGFHPRHRRLHHTVRVDVTCSGVFGVL